MTPDGELYILDYQCVNGAPVTMYRLAEVGDAFRNPVAVGSFPHYSAYCGPESMDIVPSVNYILIKYIDSVWIYPVIDGTFVNTLLNADPIRAPYTAEKRGLSIATCKACDRYYTMSSLHLRKLKAYNLLKGC